MNKFVQAEQHIYHLNKLCNPSDEFVQVMMTGKVTSGQMHELYIECIVDN